MADVPPYPGTPRWVKVSGVIVGVLVLLIVILVFTGVGGPHGPDRHRLSGDVGGYTPPSRVAQEPSPSGGGLAGHTPPAGGHQ